VAQPWQAGSGLGQRPDFVSRHLPQNPIALARPCLINRGRPAPGRSLANAASCGLAPPCRMVRVAPDGSAYRRAATAARIANLPAFAPSEFGTGDKRPPRRRVLPPPYPKPSLPAPKLRRTR
jgi:hypothetical protein